MITTINPATGERIREYREFSFQEIEAIIAKATEAAKHWKRTKFEQREPFSQKNRRITPPS